MMWTHFIYDYMASYIIMVKDHLGNIKGNGTDATAWSTLTANCILYAPSNRLDVHTTTFVTLIMGHRLKWEIAKWAGCNTTGQQCVQLCICVATKCNTWQHTMKASYSWQPWLRITKLSIQRNKQEKLTWLEPGHPQYQQSLIVHALHSQHLKWITANTSMWCLPALGVFDSGN